MLKYQSFTTSSMEVVNLGGVLREESSASLLRNVKMVSDLTSNFNLTKRWLLCYKMIPKNYFWPPTFWVEAWVSWAEQ